MTDSISLVKHSQFSTPLTLTSNARYSKRANCQIGDVISVVVSCGFLRRSFMQLLTVKVLALGILGFTGLRGFGIKGVGGFGVLGLVSWGFGLRGV